MDFDTIIFLSKEFTTLLFSVFFTGVMIWAYSKRNKEKIECIKFSIFDEDELRRME